MSNEVSNLPAEQSAANDAPVTREEFSQLMQRIDAQSRYLAKLEKSISGKSQSAPSGDAGTNGNGEMPGLREQVAKLADEQRQIREERERLQRGKIAVAISRSLQKKGISATLADDASEVQLARYRERFGVGEGDEVYHEHNGEQISLDAWASAFVATERGSAYLPTKSGPNRVSIPQNGRPTGRKVSITREQLATGNYDPTLKPNEIVVTD